MLQVDAIDVCYGDIQVLWGVSLNVSEKEIVALIGSNGAGKSTLIRSIMGLIRPRKGTILYNDRYLNTMRTDQIVELGVCVVPEGRGLFPQMTVLENLEIGACPARARRERERTLKWVYDLFPFLEERRDQLAGSLSGGEQQMLAISKVLMSQPALLICDEMSLGLAPLLVKHILQMVKRVNEKFGVSILLVDQNVHMVLKLSDRGYVIENGHITRQEKATSLLGDEYIKNAYLGQV